MIFQVTDDGLLEEFPAFTVPETPLPVRRHRFASYPVGTESLSCM
jgi:hypothetical protein